jgi:protein subunit release factor B
MAKRDGGRVPEGIAKWRIELGLARILQVHSSLQSRAQLENTREKLKLLEARLIELEQEPVTNARTRELTRLSLKKLINQLKEEIVRFEAHEVQLRP